MTPPYESKVFTLTPYYDGWSKPIPKEKTAGAEDCISRNDFINPKRQR